jgi:hypothetical protein
MKSNKSIAGTIEKLSIDPNYQQKIQQNTVVICLEKSFHISSG